MQHTLVDRSYVERGRRNEQFAEALRGADQSFQKWDWICIMCFYAALHYVKGFLIKSCRRLPKELATHKKIARVLDQEYLRGSITSELRNCYGSLRTSSEYARYQVGGTGVFASMGVEYFDSAAYRLIVEDTIERMFLPIKTELSIC